MLLNDVSKYLAHKLHLAETSFYYKRPEAKQSIQWAYSMSQYLKFQARQISERDLAYMLKNAKQHLENLLPYPENKSFTSSQNNLQKILSKCSELLQPKNTVNKITI